MNFAGRLVLGTILVVVFVVFTLVGASEFSLRNDLEADIQHSLERAARLTTEALTSDSSHWNTIVHQLSRESGLRITIIDTSGRVRAESDVPESALSSIENHRERPEVREALAGRVGAAKRQSATIGRPLMYVAVQGGPGVVRVASPLPQVDAIVHRAQRSILGAAGFALLIGALLALLAGRSVARPLTAITQAAHAIARGDAPRFPRSGIPDIDGLVRALREMHSQLADRFEELRRGRAESEALVEAMVEGVIAADGRGQIVTANAAARRLLGYELDEPLPELPHLFRIKAAREVVDAALGGTSVEGRELDLDDRTVLMSARPLPNDGALLVLHDVTELRRLEAVRRDFVANVSHELKTPLTSISGYAETLVADRSDGEVTGRFLDVILANARRMQRLVDGLLDLSRIESGGWRPKIEPLEGAAVIRETWGLFAERAAARQIHFESELAPAAAIIHADPDAVRQVLSNLFDNALRYTPDNGRILARVRAEDGGMTLSVTDSGSGISSEHLPRIFERFYRADPARSREEGGTGLGLAIVKHLVEAHGGSIAAESTLGSGTTISCWFPAPN